VWLRTSAPESICPLGQGAGGLLRVRGLGVWEGQKVLEFAVQHGGMRPGTGAVGARNLLGSYTRKTSFYVQ
jgi:hypothetical protein